MSDAPEALPVHLEGTGLPSISESLQLARDSILGGKEAVAPPEPLGFHNIDDAKAAKAEKQELANERERRLADLKKADTKLKSERAHQGDETTAKKPKSEKIVSAIPHEDRALRRQTIERATKDATSKALLDPRQLKTPEAREQRRALRDRFPGTKLSEVFERFESWERAFRADPVGTREALLQTYLSVSPQNFSRSRAPESDKGKSISDALARASEDQADLADLGPYIEKYGAGFPTILRQLYEFDRDMLADPAGTSARLAANYGAPVTAQQQQVYEAQQQRSADINRGLELVLQHNVLPGLEDPDMQEKVADILESKEFGRTQDGFADLKRAFEMAQEQMAKRKADEKSAATASRRTRAASSIAAA